MKLQDGPQKEWLFLKRQKLWLGYTPSPELASDLQRPVCTNLDTLSTLFLVTYYKLLQNAQCGGWIVHAGPPEEYV